MSVGDKVKCPYCGEDGRVIRLLDIGMDVSHEEGTTTIIGKATGEPMEIKTFLDGCSAYGKIGSRNHSVNQAPQTVSYEEPL